MQNTLLLAGLIETIGKRIELYLLRLKAALLLKLLRHPLLSGQIIYSPGGTFKYRVVGACCRLYDRECLPYPCCSLDWHGKQLLWRRIGRRLVPDVVAKRSPSYRVELVDCPNWEPFVTTLNWLKLSPQQQQWWYAKRPLIVAQQKAVASKSEASQKLPTKCNDNLSHQNVSNRAIYEF